jgi:phenylacetate-CoA ligase
LLRLPAAWVAAVCEPAWDLYERSVRLRTFGDLQRSQWFGPAQLEALRAERLRRLVRHAATTTPFYRRRFQEAGLRPDGVRDISDLRSLPLLTKADVRERLPDLLSRDYDRSQLVPAKTGGSTGEALRVFCDRAGVQRRAGAALRADTWSGWRLGEPVAAVWGNPPAVKSWRGKVRRLLKDRLFYLDTMRINEEAISRFVQQWRRWRPGLLYGHAHSLFLLAERLEARKVVLRPHGVVATSMMLLEPEREVIERIFGVQVTNRYGCEEVSLIACECEAHRGLHVNAEHVIVEVLRADGSPCADGEDGRIVVTEFVNLGMPMIRYELGDRGIPSGRTCSCGRGLPLLERITGRVADFLIAADGSRVAGVSLIEKTLTRLEGLRQLQLIQPARGRLQVNLVPDDRYGQDVALALTAGLRESLGADLCVDIRLVERIAPDAAGKYRFAICNVQD